MKEKIDFSVRDAIKTSRGIKEKSKIQAINLKGSFGKNLEKVQEKVNEGVARLLAENNKWIIAQKNKIEEILSGFDNQEVFEAFEDGLMMFFRQQYRLFTLDQKKGSKEIPDILKDKEYIRQQITAYTFDFIQSLKVSQKEGKTPKQALELAKLSYHHDPDILRKLTDKDLDKVIVNHVLFQHNTQNPEKSITSYIARIEELISKYPSVNRGVIKHAVLYYPSNPESFIEKHKNDKSIEPIRKT